MEVSLNGGTPKSSILATHLTHTDMFAEDLQSRQDRAGSSRGRKGNQNKLVPTSCKVKEMIGIGIATCGMQVLGLESQPRLESQPVGCRLFGRDRNRIANWIATCGMQVLGLESQPRSESQPAGCRLLGLESQPAGCDSIRNLRSAGCELNRNLRDAGFGHGIATSRLRIESQPCGVQVANWIATCGMQVGLESQPRSESQPVWVAGFWDWNRNLQVANWIATCGMQVLGLQSQLRLESQPVGCRLYRRDRKWSASQLAGCELNRNLQDASRFWDWNRNLEVNRNLQVAGFWDWNRNLQVATQFATCGVQVANWIATCGMRVLGLESQLAGCELNRNLRDAGFGTGIATSTRIATCGLQAL